jgi:hypothetical protein
MLEVELGPLLGLLRREGMASMSDGERPPSRVPAFLPAISPGTPRGRQSCCWRLSWTCQATSILTRCQAGWTTPAGRWHRHAWPVAGSTTPNSGGASLS